MNNQHVRTNNGLICWDFSWKKKKKINKEENYSKYLKKVKGIIIIMIIINTIIDIYFI